MNVFFNCFLIITFTNLLRLRGDSINENSISAQPINHLRSKRAALAITKFPIWPNSTVPYYLDCPEFNKTELNLFKISLDEIQKKTCLKFVQMQGLDTYKNFIHVWCKPEEGCRAELGYKGRPQKLNLKLPRGNDLRHCITKRKIQHEFMHALGFQHEHNSPIRNKYIKIVKENIADGWEKYFKISNRDNFDLYGCPYDYNSIMQVDSFRHSKSKKLPVIISLDKNFPINKLGKAKSVSKCDIKRIRKMYCKR